MLDAPGKGAIFVLGLQRSGTTWLANMLAGSGVVAAVTAEDHHGIHESVYFSHFAQAFGSFSDPQARSRFRIGFAHSDYFLLTGLSEQVLDDAIMQSHDHAEVFERIMRRFAAKQACPHWVEKSPHHTLLAERLQKRFPEARFVCVTRDSETLLASRLAAYGRVPSTGWKRLKDLLRGTVTNTYYTRSLTAFADENPQAVLLHYDDMVADPAGAQAQLVAFLGLDVAPAALTSGFVANTSHARGKATQRLDATDKRVIRLGGAVAAIVPLWLLQRIEQMRQRRRGDDWPDWVWKRSGWSPTEL